MSGPSKTWIERVNLDAEKNRQIAGRGKMRRGQFLEHEDVLRLLRSEIERAGGQAHWAKRVGIDRTNLSKVVTGTRPLTKSVLKALKLRIIYAPPERSPVSRTRKTRETPDAPP
jgi:DNA-binding phage protein